jgi:hypothetical protein
MTKLAAVLALAIVSVCCGCGTFGNLASNECAMYGGTSDAETPMSPEWQAFWSQEVYMPESPKSECKQ